MSEIVKQKYSKRGNPAWKRGVSGNPNGRPRMPEIEELRIALSIAQTKNNKSFLQHFVERAYLNDNVAIALAKKLIPDQLQGQGFGDDIRTQIFEGLNADTIRGIITKCRESISQARPV